MIHLLKGKAKWTKVHVQDDLPKETLNQRRDIRCIASLARTMDIVSGERQCAAYWRSLLV